MTKRRLIAMAAVSLAAILAIAGYFMLDAYAGSDDARASLLIKYFRALSSADTSLAMELTADDFVSDLGVPSLERGSYELYDFGEPSEGVVRFLLVMQGAVGPKRAIVGDMKYRRTGVTNLIESITKVDEGTRLKE